MKKIPIKKLNTDMIIEYYCDRCDESYTYYPALNELRHGRASFF